MDLVAQENKIPIWQKINLTIKEAVEYSNIGESTLRELLRDRDCPFRLYVGKKYLIKRKEFEKFLENKRFL